MASLFAILMGILADLAVVWIRGAVAYERCGFISMTVFRLYEGACIVSIYVFVVVTIVFLRDRVLGIAVALFSAVLVLAGVLNGSIDRRHPFGVALLRASSALITGPSGGCGAFSVGVWHLVVGVEGQVCVSNTDLCVVGVALVVYPRGGGW
jgi:hypothetical protein